jgi:L-aminopeptidase/D-esterase-like protein
MAYAACESATSEGIAEGCVGAGTGATVGKLRGAGGAMKGGIGIAVADGDGCAAAAIAVVNAFGDVRDAEGRIIAGARLEDGSFVDTAKALAAGAERGGFVAGTNTTLVVVALDCAFSRVELQSIAEAGGRALLKRITPAGTISDGDIVFALAPMDGPKASLAEGERVARQAVEAAIERAVRLAVGRDGVPGLAD